VSRKSKPSLCLAVIGAEGSSLFKRALRAGVLRVFAIEKHCNVSGKGLTV
jgi:hypothetical protein